ncbi:hypothetical protein [Helicobacter sp. T3_23-1056]
MTQIPHSALITLFSTTRLNDYTNPHEHEANLALIGNISHKIGILEIVLRNRIDSLMTNAQKQDWLLSLPRELESKGEFQAQKRDKFISTQSLGFWVRLVEIYKIHNKIFGEEFLDSFDFAKYYAKNKRTFKSKHNRVLRHHKVSAILQLFRLIRNRAFHFENLYKMNKKGPRLSVKIYNQHGESAIFSIHPSKIIDFLNDLIASFDTRLITYGENV